MVTKGQANKNKESMYNAGKYKTLGIGLVSLDNEPCT